MKKKVLTKDQEKEVMEKMDEDGVEKPREVVYTKNIDSEEIGEYDDIGSSKSGLGFDPLIEMIKDTRHLKGFDIFNKDLGLDGDSYDSVKKALYYFHHSIKQDTRGYDINKKVRIDNRSHLLAVTAPGMGKTTIKNQIKRVMRDEEELDGVIEVTGLSHPEQLVGKVVYKGKGDNKERVEKIGICGYKVVLNDESQGMLNEINEVYAKAQRIKRIAQDTMGDNEISKKLVADDPKDVLSYYSPSRFCDFAHPDKLLSPFFDTGSFRRPMAFNINHEAEIDLDYITDFNFEKQDKDYISWIDYLNRIYNKKHNYTQFDDRTLRIISHFHKCLLYYLLKHKNPNAFRYALQSKYAIRGMLCKYVFILAIAKNEKTPSLDTVLSACSDTVLFILESIKTYNDLGDMGTSASVWGGCCEEDAQALEHLLRNNCLTKETSSISIKKFISLLAHFYGCKPTQSRGYYYRLKKDGFIQSSQVGNYDSKVWLTFLPTEVKLVQKEFNPLDFWEKEFQGVGNNMADFTPCKHFFSDGKPNTKSAGFTGFGVLTCLSVKYMQCVEVYGDKNKNNIYRDNIPQFLEPCEPSQKPKPTATIKHKSQGVKTPQKSPTPSKLNKDDRETQFNKAKECKNIEPKCTKKEILKYYKKNSNASIDEMFDKFGSGYMKFRNELKKEGLI